MLWLCDLPRMLVHDRYHNGGWGSGVFHCHLRRVDGACYQCISVSLPSNASLQPRKLAGIDECTNDMVERDAMVRGTLRRHLMIAAPSRVVALVPFGIYLHRIAAERRVWGRGCGPFSTRVQVSADRVQHQLLQL